MKLIQTIILSCFLTLAAVIAPAGATSYHQHHPRHPDLNPRPWYFAIEHAGPYVFNTFGCIIHHESTSTWDHPNLGDNRPWGSSGVFQFEDQTWLADSGFHMHIWRATLREQAIGAVREEQRNGFNPWTTFAFCR